MCTLSWAPLAGGYALAMNRDERRSRAPGDPPSRREREGIAILCPSDREAGGTWISVNDHGLSLALLNRYDDTPHDAPENPVSRGLLVAQLAGATSPARLESALRGSTLGSYRPFTLVCVGPAPSVVLLEWDGRSLAAVSATEPGLLRASSAVDQAGAERERGRLFREAVASPGGLDPGGLTRWHRSHEPERGALSICMHREDAATVSFSLIRVGPDSVTLHQVEGPPCESGLHSALTLARIGAAGR